MNYAHDSQIGENLNSENLATANCRNCGAALTGAFCAVCGQKGVNLNPTLKDLIHEIWHELSDLDGKLIPSVRQLFTAPGALTLEHYAGRRARYLSPMRLYLVFSILYFAVAALTPANTNIRITVGADRSGSWTFESTPEPRNSDPEELRQLGFESDDQLQQATSAAITRWLPRMMFVLVPVFAALIALTVRRLRWNYPRHVHFSLHLHAAWFLLLTISALGRAVPYQWVGNVVSPIVLALIILYFVLAMRRTYGLTTWGAVWRVMEVGVAYVVLLALSVITIILPIVLPAITNRS